MNRDEGIRRNKVSGAANERSNSRLAGRPPPVFDTPTRSSVSASAVSGADEHSRTRERGKYHFGEEETECRMTIDERPSSEGMNGQ